MEVAAGAAVEAPVPAAVVVPVPAAAVLDMAEEAPVSSARTVATAPTPEGTTVVAAVIESFPAAARKASKLSIESSESVLGGGRGDGRAHFPGRLIPPTMPLVQ